MYEKNNKKTYKNIFKYFICYKKDLILLTIIWITNVVIGIIEPFITAKEYTSIINIDTNNIIKYSIILFLIQSLSNIIFS